MRIILIQAEIEAAVKAYVLNQIAIREDQEVTIEFKNTRGDDGATAEINIGTPRTPSQPRPVPVQKAPVAAISTGEERVDPAEQASHQHQSEQAHMPQHTPEAEVPIAAPEPKEEKPAVAPVSSPDSSPAPAGPKSLFANLVKPKHDPQPE